MYETIQSTIYEDDRLSTLTTFSRENLYYVFLEEKGYYIWNIAEKWKKNENNYIWVECIIHFLQEPESGDIKGLMVIKDINDKKEKN